MAKQIVVFDDANLNLQIREILDNLDPNNFKENNPMIMSDSGKMFVLEVDDSGNLSTKEV